MTVTAATGKPDEAAHLRAFDGAHAADRADGAAPGTPRPKGCGSAPARGHRRGRLAVLTTEVGLDGAVEAAARLMAGSV